MLRCCPSADGSPLCVFSRLASTASSQTQPPTATNLMVRAAFAVLSGKAGPGTGSMSWPELPGAFTSGPAGSAETESLIMERDVSVALGTSLD